jgi:predicted P-loop ATPase
VDRPPFLTQTEWEEWVREHGISGAKRSKPAYLSDEEWEEHLRTEPARRAKRKAKRGNGAGAGGARPDWLADCLVDDKGRFFGNLANTLIALRADPSVESAFAFDEMAQTAMLMRPLPVAPNGKSAGNGPVPRSVRDADISQLQEWLQHQGLPRTAKDTVHQAVDQRARERSFHPVRQWLENLAWDQTPRLSGWLKTYLGATDPDDFGEYLVAIGRMFLIAMVARIYQPGCKADYLLVLEGDQGVEKSRACAVLAGEWFSDSLPNIHDKDSRQHLRGKWLIEIAELAGVSRTETEALKAFITRDCERYRPSYGRKDVIEPRQCLFVGTTNRDVYIRDETGGRRFWPVSVGSIDVAALTRDREQLFAEAVDRYRHGEQWWPDPVFEKAHVKPQQESRRDADAWEPKIAGWLGNRLPDEQVLIWEVARHALGIEPGRLTRADQNRVAGALMAAGWRRASRTGKGQWWARKQEGAG